MSETSAQAKRNLDYYGRTSEGRSDYWRLMAAPRYRVTTILRILRELRPSSVIDLGCGDGALLRAIGAEVPSAKLAGVDLASSQIEENRRRDPHVDWYAANLEDEQFALPGRFAAIVASELIEHLADPDALLRALHRIAADDAVLILSTQSGRVNETERMVGHLQHFSAERMTEMLAKAGWRPLRVWNAGFPFQDLSKWAANLFPRYVMHHYGERRYGPVQRFVAATLRVLFLFNSGTRGAQLFAVARRQA